MAANFTKPVTSDLRADVLAYIRDNLAAQAKLFDGETLTGTPVNAIRYSSGNLRFEKWNGSAWGELALGFLPLAGGTLTGALSGTSANFTAGLTVNGSAVWHAGNLNPAGYLPLAGGTMAGILTTHNLTPDGNGTRALGADAARWAVVHSAEFREAGTALSARYSAAGHSHDFLPLTGGTLTGPLTGTSGNFTASLTVNGVAVSLSTHTHSYLPLGGGTLTGTLNATNAVFSGSIVAAAGIELGHASDTTLLRIAAGRASVEGREVVTLGFDASGARITRGTAAPSGGSDGDIYLQYV